MALPFKWYPKEEILAHAAAWRLVDLSESNGRTIDRVIATKFPAYFVRHPCKVTWLMHQYRGAYELAGTELDIIAAVVLGGASILGGRGSVLGAVLGVLLISVIKNSLILMGVPGTWQRTAVGVLLVVGVSIQALGARKRARRSAVELVAAEVGR